MNILEYFNSEELSDYKRLVNDEERRIMCQYKFRTNFKLLVYLLGYRDTGKFHEAEMEKVGNERVLGNVPVRRLWIWSRGFFKTSIITEAHTIYLIVNNLNVRILISSFTLDVAKSMLRNIKSHFTNNDEFRFFFREFCPKPNKEGKIEFGTTESFTTPNRTKVLKEPTVMCAGVGTNITGLHFDWMKSDDLVNKDAVSNDTQIQASKDHYSALRQLYDNPTIPREDVIGTIYHFNDLHSNLIKNDLFRKSICPVHRDGVYVFPERINEEGFMKISQDPSMSPYDVQSQYLLNPINPADAKFKSEWWKEYDVIPEGLAEYVVVDPASTQKKKSDYTVIERWGIDADSRHYLLEGTRDKLTVFQRIDKVAEVAKRAKRLCGVKYEVLGGRHGDLESLKKKFFDENIGIVPTETKGTNSSKADRIEQRLCGQFHANMILMPKSLPFRSEFDGKTYDFVQLYKLEFLQFPFAEHDDILDCHSQMFEDPTTLIKGLKQAVENRKEWGTADDWDRLYASIDKEQGAFMTREQAINNLKAKQWARLLKGKI